MSVPPSLLSPSLQHQPPSPPASPPPSPLSVPFLKASPRPGEPLYPYIFRRTYLCGQPDEIIHVSKHPLHPHQLVHIILPQIPKSPVQNGRAWIQHYTLRSCQQCAHEKSGPDQPLRKAVVLQGKGARVERSGAWKEDSARDGFMGALEAWRYGNGAGLGSWRGHKRADNVDTDVQGGRSRTVCEPYSGKTYERAERRAGTVKDVKTIEQYGVGALGEVRGKEGSGGVAIRSKTSPTIGATKVREGCFEVGIVQPPERHSVGFAGSANDCPELPARTRKQLVREMSTRATDQSPRRRMRRKDSGNAENIYIPHINKSPERYSGEMKNSAARSAPPDSLWNPGSGSQISSTLKPNQRERGNTEGNIHHMPQRIAQFQRQNSEATTASEPRSPTSPAGSKKSFWDRWENGVDKVAGALKRKPDTNQSATSSTYSGSVQERFASRDSAATYRSADAKLMRSSAEMRGGALPAAEVQRSQTLPLNRHEHADRSRKVGRTSDTMKKLPELPAESSENQTWV